MSYQITIVSSAQRQIEALPTKVGFAVLAFIDGPLRENPKRVGKPLGAQLSGLWSARRGDYQVVYEVNDDSITVTVVRVGPRRNVYR